MAASILPAFAEFQQPSLARPVPDTAPDVPYARSWLFDFSTGEVVVDGSGRPVECEGYEAAAQAAALQVLIERFAYDALPPETGVELITARRLPSDALRRAAVQATITDALLRGGDRRFKDVSDFEFETGDRADALYVSFVVTFAVGPSVRIAPLWVGSAFGPPPTPEGSAPPPTDPDAAREALYDEGRYDIDWYGE